MTLTLPTVYAAGYSGDYTDFLKPKMDRSGAVRVQEFKVSVPAASATNVLVGLVPFNKGFRFHQQQSFIANAVLDTGATITIDIGYTYYDSTLGTTVANAWVAASTAWQNSATTSLTLLQVPETNVGIWKAVADGWLTLTIHAGPTTTTGDVFGQISGSYDTDPYST